MFVIAHRGANKFAPQNTIEAFVKAADMGADGVETDVRITKDGQLVLCHNTTVNKTSNGRGKVMNLYFGDMRDMDFGSWFGRRFSNTPIPTLDDFLEVMKTTDVSILDIELKPVTHKDLSFVPEVIYKVRSHGLLDRLLISSFDRKILIKAKAIDERVKTGFLYPFFGEAVAMRFVSPVNMAAKSGFDYILPHCSYINEGIVKKAHKAGLKIAPWTVNDISLIDKLCAWGADGVITDYPDIMKNKIESI